MGINRSYVSLGGDERLKGGLRGALDGWRNEYSEKCPSHPREGCLFTSEARYNTAIRIDWASRGAL